MERSWAHLVYCPLRQTMRPTVLLAMTTRWIPMIRLAMALKNAGFKVDALCLPRHPLQKTQAASETYVYDSLAPLKSFASAIAASIRISSFRVTTSRRFSSMLYMSEIQPRLKMARSYLTASSSVRSDHLRFPRVYARAGLLEIAQEEGIRIPKTEVLTGVNQIREWGVRKGFPAVLKSNGSSGGEGVRIVHSLEQAERAFRTLQAPPLLARAAKRALVDGDKTLILPSLLRRRLD